MRKLTDKEIKELAEKAGLTFQQLKTVVLVEARSDGFLPSGKIKILFEAHQFSKFTSHKYDKTHPDISCPVWNKTLYKGPEGEWVRMEKAKSLDKIAALKSASYGLGQVMGFNFREAGYGSVEEMVEDFSKCEANQLKGMLHFIKCNVKMFIALKHLDWETFAELYNGPRYKDNDYDTKLANVFNSLV